MIPFIAAWRSQRVLVIAITSHRGSSETVTQATFIDRLGRIDAAPVGDLRIDFDSAWRPADWPHWPEDRAEVDSAVPLFGTSRWARE